MKKGLVKSVAILILSIILLNFSLIINVYADDILELGTPSGLTWKDGSTATASWNVVPNANYYKVNIYVYDRGTLIGQQETGTSDTEIDVQQEINYILSTIVNKEDKYDVKYDVTAMIISDKDEIKGSCSEMSLTKTINLPKGSVKLNTPTNITIDNSYNATWTDVPEADYYTLSYEINGKKEYIGSCVFRTVSSNYAHGTVQNGVFKSNLKVAFQVAYKKYIEQGHNEGTISIRFTVGANVDFGSNTNYTDSDQSEYSSQISFSGNSIQKLATPTNITIDNSYNATWTDVPEADYYTLSYEINGKKEYIGSCVFRTASSNYAHGTVQNGVFKSNLKVAFQAAYKKYIEQGHNEGTISIRFTVKANMDFGSNTNYTDSSESVFSSIVYYNPAGSTVINNIILSPNKPVVAIGKSIYIGKTIDPENALYSIIRWNSNNHNIVTIDNMGKITGVRKGNTIITAQINNASQSAEVSVYEISSNISNSEENSQVIDKATDIITAITKEEDTSNTDITDVSDAINEIETGAENGDDFNIDVNYNTKTAVEYNDIESKIKEKYGEDKQIAGGYDVRMELSHTDNQNNKHHIGNITNFDNKVSFEVNLLANMPTIKLGQKRKYSMAKLHNNELELLNIKLSDNKISTSSNEFSDFILLYQDVDMKGDVSIDSKVNITDVALVNAHVKKTKLLTGEELTRADINGDGKVNITDVALVNSHVKKVKMLED